MVSCVRVRNLAGSLLLEMPSPSSFEELLSETGKACRVQPELLTLVCDGTPLKSLDEISGVVELSAIVDDTPCFTWDIHGVPNCSKSLDGATITYVNEEHDYMNVLTEVPIHEGVHFVEFHMHSLQDEPWFRVWGLGFRL